MPKGDGNRKLTDEQREQIVVRYQTRNPDGTWPSSGEIAREFGVTANCVIDRLKRAGVSIRSNSDAHAGKACKPVTRYPKGERPLCKCGCGLPVEWEQKSDKWQTYYPGHYRPDAPYKHRDFWDREYTGKGRTLPDLAAECGVQRGSLIKAAQKLGVRLRSQGESLAISGAVSGARNPAWKGGVAQWSYTSDWKRIARRIRKRDNYTCQLCHTHFPTPSKSLHVHHIDGDKTNNNDANLVTVCATCHPAGKRKGKHKATPERSNEK